jgi:hypothetical protein
MRQNDDRRTPDLSAGTYGAAAAAAGPMRTEPLGRGLGRPFGSPAA